MINKLNKKKLDNWNRTKDIYLNWISENKLKKIFTKDINFQGLSLWWVNLLTFKDNMVDKSWYYDLNNTLNYNVKPKSQNDLHFSVLFYIRTLKNLLTTPVLISLSR